MKRKCVRKSLWPAVLGLALGLAPMMLEARLTGYLKIDDIPGESQRADHEDEIDLYNIQWRIDSTPESGRIGSRPVVQPLTIKKWVDKSSPYLALAALRGRNLGTVVLSVRKDSGDSHLDYLVITMENVQVSSYAVDSENAEGPPGEEIGLTFTRVTYKYVEQADDHSAGDEHEVEFDIAAGA